MSIKNAMKQALALSEYKKAIKEKVMKDSKEWNADVLIDGGVSYFPLNILYDKTGKAKIKKVKVVVVLQHQDSGDVSGKGKFAFRNALGNRVFLTVRSYIDANEVVKQMFGTVCYRVSSSLI